MNPVTQLYMWCVWCKERDDVRERNGKKWFECSECATWYHNECQGLARPPRGTFICISCEN